MNEFKVGLLAIATIIAVAFMSFKITSGQSGFGQYETYRTIVKDASGIFPKTPIKVAGIAAGRINSIELQGNTALITFEILKQIHVTKNSKIRIKSVGFLGDKYIEIFIGDSPEMLRKYDFIDSEEAAGIETLVKDTSEILQDVKKIVGTIKESVAPEGQVSPVKLIIADVQTLVQNTKLATASLNRILQGNEEKINTLVSNLEDFSYELAYNMDKGNPDAAISDLKRIMANADKLTKDLSEIVADVKRGKGTMGKLLVEDEIADEVKNTLAGVKKIFGRADEIRTELEVFTGAKTDGGAKSDIALRFFHSPERFYHLGVTTSEFGPVEETQIETEVNGTTSTAIKRERDNDTFTFNAMIGRKVQDWAFRGGLIESNGGLGVDYILQDFNTKFSLDAFDYREGKGPNVRFTAETQLYNVLYGRISGNDLVRKDGRNAIISAGLRFNDEDLKGILGLFLF